MCKWILAACAALAFGSASAETLSDYLAQDCSHAMLVLGLPFDVLQTMVAAGLPPQYSGSKPDPTNALVDDTLSWSAQPSAIVLGQKDGCLTGEGSAKGTVQVQGKIKALVKIPVSASADLLADGTFQACPKLQSDWSLDAGLTGSVQLTEADLYGVSVRGLFQDSLDKGVNEALTHITEDLKKPAFLTDKVVSLWNSVCQLSDDAKSISVRPRAVAASQPMVHANSLRITFVVSGDVVKRQDPPEACPALPTSLIVLE